MSIKNRFRISLAVSVFFLAAISVAQAQYSGGSGTADDPYQIGTAADLITLGETPDDYDKHFILTADIDLDPNLPGRRVFDRAVIAPDTDDAEYWFQGTRFEGVFDGNGYTISHLTIIGESYLGLFGELWFGATVSNLGLEAVDVDGRGDYVAGLAGHSHGMISRCYCIGAVTGDDFVGALVGDNEHRAWITTSYGAATVTGDTDVGGLVGVNAGGIAVSYSTGTVMGRRYVGGLLGGNSGSGWLVTCYCISEIEGDKSVGGFVGYNHGNITASYSASAVSGNDLVGGLVGERWHGSTIASFWDIQTSGQAASEGGTGMTTAAMQTISTYLKAGWDFADETLNGTCDFWQLRPGSYPQLHYDVDSSPVMPHGSGTEQQPYLIREGRDLGTVWFEPLAHYRLETPVDLSGTTWSMAVVPWFAGTFDGNGLTVSNLRIQGSSNLGLFGQLGGEAELSSFSLQAVDIKGTSFVGGLVGSNFGRITTSNSVGKINGAGWDVGGVVGRNEGTVTQCRSAGHVSGYGNVGGLVGHNGDEVLHSYSTAAVIGTTVVGGLVGEHPPRGLPYGRSAYIIHCYSAGPVSGEDVVGGLIGWHGSTGGNNAPSVVEYSFWDIEASGQLESPGGTGLTTTEMQTAATFLEAGWDFVGETENGPNDVWKIVEGQTYPLLSWQKYGGGTGEPNDPYLIYTAEHLNALGAEPNDYDKHFRLRADIDLAGYVYDRAVIAADIDPCHPGPQGPAFTGIFNGNGHTISHLSVRGESYLGMFGTLASGAGVSNLGLEAVDINGTGYFIGGLGGWNQGSVITSYSSGAVTGGWEVGGLIGVNSPPGDLTACYSTASVRGTPGECSGIGGLLGSNVGQVSCCYSAGPVSGSGEWVGGFVGRQWFGCRDRLYVGDGTATHCFWDVETSGQASNAGGTGLTTAEMQTAGTFLEAGWDFIDETENGTDDIWWILEDQDYPRLWWESVEDEPSL